MKLLKEIILIGQVIILGSCTIIPPAAAPAVTPDSITQAITFPVLTERNRLLGALTAERTCYDVTYYNLDISIDPENKYIKGFVDIHASAARDFSKLQIDLAQTMILNKIQFGSVELEYQRIEDAVFIDFPKMIKGQDFSFRVYYEGTPRAAKRPPWDGGFVWEKDKKGRPYISVTCEGDGASLWWPCKDHISDEPDSMRMSYTVPEELICVANGRLENKKSLSDGKITYTWVVKNPINNYNVSLQLGYYVLVQDTLQRQDKIEYLNHYVLDYHAEVAREHFKQARGILHFFEDKFGEYPWWNDGFKLVEVSYLGMEHQSAVTYGNNFRNRKKGRSWLGAYHGIVDGLLFHETAHEWWGNSVTAEDPAHMWIHEGMAVYSEAMFMEERLGYDVAIDFLLLKRRSIKNKLPIVGPENENYWAFGDSYNKGAWIMHTLRTVIDNDDLWFNILKSFAVNNRRSHVKTEHFRDLVNTSTGIDFTLFFDQYFYKSEIPTFEYEQTGNQIY
ncbi:MAG: M1 family metallopeptidase [Candidatus Neomarinimicrobiota bacterium]